MMADPSQPLGNLSPAEKRAYLTQLLRKKAEKPRVFPLSFAQQRLWFLDQLEPGNATYLIPLAMRIEGPLIVNVLEKCLDELIRRHQSLRTTFGESDLKPIQIIHPVAHCSLPLVDLSRLVNEGGKHEHQAQRLMTQEQEQPCSLQHGPLLRSYLMRFDDQEHVLLLTFHHIISDGWSVQVFLRELGILYPAFVAAQPSPLSSLSIQYTDYAVWQRQWLQGEVLETLLAYWLRQLGGYTPLQLPVDHIRPEGTSQRGADYPFAFSADLSEAIATLGNREGTTLFMTLLTAFMVLLYRYTGQTDLVLGTDIASRMHTGTEELIGFFVSLLVLRNRLDGMLSFCEVLSRTKEMVLGAYTHQDIPFEILAEHLLSGHTTDPIPLVQCIFVLQNIPAAGTEVRELKISPFQNEGSTTAKFALAVFMRSGTQGLSGIVNYNRDLFEEKSIITMMRRFEILLQSIVSRPEAAIDLLDFYMDAEKNEKKRKKHLNMHKLRTLKENDF